MHHRYMTACYLFTLIITLFGFTTSAYADQKPEIPRLLVCLALDDDAAYQSLSQHLIHKLSMAAQERFSAHSADQLLFLMQGKHLSLPTLLQNLQAQDGSIHSSFSDFITAFNAIAPKCYTGPGRSRHEIAELIHSNSLVHSPTSRIYADDTLTVLTLDNQITVSISHTDTDHAALGLHQLGMDNLSERIWLGTSHSVMSLTQLSGSDINDFLNQVEERTVHNNIYPQNKTEAFRHASEKQKTTQSHQFRKTSHDDTSEAVVWAVLAVAIVFAAVLPFGFFMAFL
ncbi:hypothetical protein [Kistimonas asteriae]|uniref:hypothetical protein n=1 Tax=Kistimonas asteriae TaxID=517724 RepID=UPI001BA58164|nr:hypothetical protein [Kistimonas asteriae]